ncbi:MAG: DUF2784 domain-containing protein [Planctomycetota bacterium]|jgi:hypothetical protein
MIYRVLADVVVVAHLAFVVFAVLGGLLVLRWRWVVWLHVPAAAWAALIEFAGWICPLTPLENRWRARGGVETYETGFVEQYIVPVLYPTGLTRSMQVAIGIGVVLLNVVIYALIIRRASRRRRRAKGGAR